ncbi:helix-turn-helix domain-containing protein [Enterovirga rhinocerotis]|uniref:Putative transcriptional regulator n=1 Tax=Enterovirga rhinocerotis TaxID=1339210 RepID=A0A4R7BRF7_9HYPH|nr:helix-turn-helix domain-containing protein [Enterovirga rhinocerotis]TDR87971.1 putative transcriptional regulator [Enterovirga rhinocerotis]
MTSAFDDIMEGLAQAARHAAGEEVPGLVVHVPAKLDVAAIREKTNLSQPAFARSIGVQTATLRQWEQGRRDPTGPARVLLALVDKRPGIVGEVLGAPAAKRRA